MRTGLVLEGGAMRGIYVAGVLDAFMDHQIQTDGVIGVSAGAIHGCSYVSGQRGRSIRYYMKYRRNWKFMSVWSFLLTGNLVNTQFCYHDLPDKLDIYDHDAFEASQTKFYVTCTNVETGQPEYIHMEDMREIDYLRASASMPIVSQIVEVGGKKLLDGGVSDSVPVKAFREMGYNRCVLVLTRQKGYRKKASDPRLIRHLYKMYPKFVKTMEERYLHYNEMMEEIECMEEAGDILVLRPSRDPKIGRMEKNAEKVQGVYQLGYQDALERIEDIKTFLKGEQRDVMV